MQQPHKHNFYIIVLALIIGASFYVHTTQSSTITVMQGTDTLSASRSVINTNFANLNADKMELSSWYSTTTWAGGDNKLTVGGVFNASSTAHITGNLTVGGLGGSGTSCLQVSNTGLISATGAVCGSGGGGGSGEITFYTIGGTKYLAASSSIYDWNTRSSGLLAHGSSTFSGNLNVTGSTTIGSLSLNGEFARSLAEINSFSRTVTVCSTQACDYITDGTADNVEIQQAIFDLAEGGGGTIELMNQNYQAATTIVMRDKIKIVGKGNDTTVTLDNTVNASVFSSATSTSLRNFFVEFQDFRIDGNDSGNTTGHCILATRAHTWRITRMHLNECAEDGVNFSAASSALSALNNYVVDTRIETVGQDGIDIGDDAPNNHLKGNIIGSTGSDGIELANAEVIVTNNHIHSIGAGADGINLEHGAADNNIIEGNYIEDDGDSAYGIDVPDTAIGNRIANNVIFNMGSDGIRIAGQFNNVTNNRAFDRQTVRTQDYGLSLTSTAKDNYIGVNTFSKNLTGQINDGSSNGFNQLFMNGTTTFASFFETISSPINASSTLHVGTTTIAGGLTVNNRGTGTSTATFGSVTRQTCFSTFASDGTQINTTWDLNGVAYTRVGAC